MPEPILLGDPGGPELVYQFGPNSSFLIEAVSFTVDLTGAGSAGDVSIEYRTPTGEVIVAETPAEGLAVGTVALVTLSPFLNPCDSSTNPLLTLIPDTWPALVLTENCVIDILIADPTTGNPLAGALITGALLWAEPSGASGTLDDSVAFFSMVAPGE